ncbi:MAG: hypothetical protein V4719_10085 [Planctomycetota bacterium]
MARLVSKGTRVQQKIATVFVTIAQCLSIEGPEAETETFEARMLDGPVGIGYDPTGYSEGGSVKQELFFDPALAGHMAITDVIANPRKVDLKLIFSDDTEWPFTAGGVKLGPSADMADGLKADVEWKLDGLVDYPTE